MSVKLTYFDARGLGEPIRMILAYGKQDFEDFRFPAVLPPKVPAEIKPKCTWGQVPMVEMGDKKLCQSVAITRYFAKKFNLVPKDDFQAALCDEYVDAIRDYLVQWVPVFYEKDKEELDKKFNDVAKATNERFLSVFESIIKANGGKYLVGNTLTWADIYVAHVVSNVELALGKSAIGNEFPAIKNLIEKVLNTPGIKEWVEKRPTTQF